MTATVVRRSRQKETVLAKRNVFFYEMRVTRQVDVEWRLDVPGLIDALEAIPDAELIRPARGGVTGDSYEFVRVIRAGKTPAIAYVRCRDHGLPMLAREADLEPLTIAADRQLAELTHAVFFDDHIIGAEYNHYGPRISSLALYLAGMVPQCLPPNRRISIAPLVDNQPLELLRGARNIKSISLTMAPQLLEAVAATQHLSGRDTLRQMSTGYGARRIGLNMQNRSGLEKAEVVGLVDWAFEQGSDLLNAAYAVIELEDGTNQPVNLLRTRIGVEREMDLIGPSARSIAHGSAQIEIVAAFNSLEDQLLAASTLRSMGPDEDGF